MLQRDRYLSGHEIRAQDAQRHGAGGSGRGLRFKKDGVVVGGSGQTGQRIDQVHRHGKGRAHDRGGGNADVKERAGQDGHVGIIRFVDRVRGVRHRDPDGIDERAPPQIEVRHGPRPGGHVQPRQAHRAVVGRQRKIPPGIGRIHVVEGIAGHDRKGRVRVGGDRDRRAGFARGETGALGFAGRQQQQFARRRVVGSRIDLNRRRVRETGRRVGSQHDVGSGRVDETKGGPGPVHQIDGAAEARRHRRVGHGQVHGAVEIHLVAVGVHGVDGDGDGVPRRLGVGAVDFIGRAPRLKGLPRKDDNDAGHDGQFVNIEKAAEALFQRRQIVVGPDLQAVGAEAQLFSGVIDDHVGRNHAAGHGVGHESDGGGHDRPVVGHGHAVAPQLQPHRAAEIGRDVVELIEGRHRDGHGVARVFVGHAGHREIGQRTGIHVHRRGHRFGGDQGVRHGKGVDAQVAQGHGVKQGAAGHRVGIGGRESHGARHRQRQLKLKGRPPGNGGVHHGVEIVVGQVHRNGKGGVDRLGGNDPRFPVGFRRRRNPGGQRLPRKRDHDPIVGARVHGENVALAVGGGDGGRQPLGRRQRRANPNPRHGGVADGRHDESAGRVDKPGGRGQRQGFGPAQGHLVPAGVHRSNGDREQIAGGGAVGRKGVAGVGARRVDFSGQREPKHGQRPGVDPERVRIADPPPAVVHVQANVEFLFGHFDGPGPNAVDEGDARLDPGGDLVHVDGVGAQARADAVVRRHDGRRIVGGNGVADGVPGADGRQKRRHGRLRGRDGGPFKTRGGAAQDRNGGGVRRSVGGLRGLDDVGHARSQKGEGVVHGQLVPRRHQLRGRHGVGAGVGDRHETHGNGVKPRLGVAVGPNGIVELVHQVGVHHRHGDPRRGRVRGARFSRPGAGRQGFPRKRQQDVIKHVWLDGQSDGARRPGDLARIQELGGGGEGVVESPDGRSKKSHGGHGHAVHKIRPRHEGGAAVDRTVPHQSRDIDVVRKGQDDAAKGVPGGQGHLEGDPGHGRKRRPRQRDRKLGNRPENGHGNLALDGRVHLVLNGEGENPRNGPGADEKGEGRGPRDGHAVDQVVGGHGHARGQAHKFDPVRGPVRGAPFPGVDVNGHGAVADHNVGRRGDDVTADRPEGRRPRESERRGRQESAPANHRAPSTCLMVRSTPPRAGAAWPSTILRETASNRFRRSAGFVAVKVTERTAMPS